MKRAKETVNFFVLFLILSVSVLSFYRATGNGTVQLYIGGIMAATYVLWGILYHHWQKDLHFKVVLEYMLVGAIAFVLTYTLISN
jgi:lipopolysaccharide export LptBFGC system permease protein LptF